MEIEHGLSNVQAWYHSGAITITSQLSLQRSIRFPVLVRYTTQFAWQSLIIALGTSHLITQLCHFKPAGFLGVSSLYIT